MIDALIHGRLIHAQEVDGHVEGRLVLENDSPIHFEARRGSIKRALLALPEGCPLSVAGALSTSVVQGKRGHYVRHELQITSILTAAVPSSARPAWRIFPRGLTDD